MTTQTESVLSLLEICWSWFGIYKCDYFDV